LRHLPGNATLARPVPSNAALSEVHGDIDNPPCLRGKGG
jgi:hypothetical protein